MPRDYQSSGYTQSPSVLNLKYKTKQSEVETKLPNGTKKTIKVVDGGKFAAYNTATKEKYDINLPVRFAILDETPVSFIGYNESSKQGVNSTVIVDANSPCTIYENGQKLVTFTLNEYRGIVEGSQIKDESLSAKTKGLIKNTCTKYTATVFAVMEIEGKLQIVTLLLNGAALTGAVETDKNGRAVKGQEDDGWFGYIKANRKQLYTNWINIENTKEKSKGDSVFTIPMYELGERISDEHGKEIDSLMVEVRTYLNSLKKVPSQQAQVVTDQEQTYTMPVETKQAIEQFTPESSFTDDDLPF